MGRFASPSGLPLLTLYLLPYTCYFVRRYVRFFPDHKKLVDLTHAILLRMAGSDKLDLQEEVKLTEQDRASLPQSWVGEDIAYTCLLYTSPSPRDS